MSVITRLHETIAAVCPIDGISGSTQGSVRIDYAAAATAAARAAADAALAAFDWSQSAQDAWENGKARTDASAKFGAATVEAKAYKAIAKTLVDELNILRQWLADFKTQTAAATTLADLKNPRGDSAGDSGPDSGAGGDGDSDGDQ